MGCLKNSERTFQEQEQEQKEGQEEEDSEEEIEYASKVNFLMFTGMFRTGIDMLSYSGAFSL